MWSWSFIFSHLMIIDVIRSLLILVLCWSHWWPLTTDVAAAWVMHIIVLITFWRNGGRKSNNPDNYLAESQHRYVWWLVLAFNFPISFITNSSPLLRWYWALRAVDHHHDEVRSPFQNWRRACRSSFPGCTRWSLPRASTRRSARRYQYHL